SIRNQQTAISTTQASEEMSNNSNLFLNLINNHRSLLSQVIVNEFRNGAWFSVYGPEAFKSLYDVHYVQKYYEELRLKFEASPNKYILKFSPFLVNFLLHEYKARYPLHFSARIGSGHIRFIIRMNRMHRV